MRSNKPKQPRPTAAEVQALWSLVKIESLNKMAAGVAGGAGSEDGGQEIALALHRRFIGDIGRRPDDCKDIDWVRMACKDAYLEWRRKYLTQASNDKPDEVTGIDLATMSHREKDSVIKATEAEIESVREAAKTYGIHFDTVWDDGNMFWQLFIDEMRVIHVGA